MNKFFRVIILVLVAGLTLQVFAQSKNKKPVRKTTVKKTQPETVEPTETAETPAPERKDEPPETNTEFSQAKEPQKKNQAARPQKVSAIVEEEPKNFFRYEFTQPDFLVNHFIIEHDENGKGKIIIEKRDFGGDTITDPIQLSAFTLEKIKKLFQTLNFIESKEDYQSTIRQYPHLGTMKIRLKKDGQERTAGFNWTENADAKALAEEYRKIGNQFVWMFDVSVSLANQPLESPGLMDRLDTLLRINGISDPPQMIPFLKKLSNDERMPLIARNHAMRMAKEIEKKAGK